LAPHAVGGGPGPPHGTGPSPELPVFDPVLLHRLIMYSNEHGYRTTVHAVEGPSQRIAVEAGINAMAHTVYMTDTDDTIATLVATKGIPASTALGVLVDVFRIAETPSFFDSPIYRAVMTDADRANFRDGQRAYFLKTNLAAWAHKAFDYAKENFRKMYNAGAIYAIGTDRTIGPYVAEELKIVTSLGVPPLQAIRMATLNGAIYLNKQESLGSVEEGKIADLVLLNADPTKDIANVQNISSVIQDGKVIDRTKLYDLPVNGRVK
jgi:imidazolonepropionase-like amidohydrolase